LDHQFPDAYLGPLTNNLKAVGCDIGSQELVDLEGNSIPGMKSVSVLSLKKFDTFFDFLNSPKNFTFKIKFGCV
jgi:hypothetical protein